MKPKLIPTSVYRAVPFGEKEKVIHSRSGRIEITLDLEISLVLSGDPSKYIIRDQQVNYQKIMRHILNGKLKIEGR